MTNALMIGRFQFPHNGHFDGMKQIEEDGVKKLYVGVGSAQEKNTFKNPFTYDEREKMLRLGLEEKLSIPFEIFSIPDLPTDEQWKTYVENKAFQKIEGTTWKPDGTDIKQIIDVIYSGNPHVREILGNPLIHDWQKKDPIYKDVKPIYEFREVDENRISISGSTLREMLGLGKDIRRYTTDKIVDYIEQINGESRLESLLPKPRNPQVAADAIIEYNGGIVLIERKNKPFGYALPGGFVDYGESGEDAVIREAREETGLDFTIDKQIGFYSDPKRDPRKHTASVVYSGKGRGNLQALDDAKSSIVVPVEKALEMNLVFDHNKILQDYAKMRGD